MVYLFILRRNWKLFVLSSLRGVRGIKKNVFLKLLNSKLKKKILIRIENCSGCSLSHLFKLKIRSTTRLWASRYALIFYFSLYTKSSLPKKNGLFVMQNQPTGIKVYIVHSSDNVKCTYRDQKTSSLNPNSLIYNRLEVKLSFVCYDLWSACSPTAVGENTCHITLLC